MTTPFEVRIQTLPDRVTLAEWWEELESRADLSFFTSWSWITAWLDLLPDGGSAARLLIAEQGGRRMGMGILVEGRAKLLKTFKIRAWRLHTVGILEIDDLSMEYNDFLMDRSVAPVVRRAMLNWLVTKAPEGVIEIRGANAEIRALAETPAEGMIARRVPLTSYLVALKDARAGHGYLAMISSNVRAQIRRSLKAYSAAGDISVETAMDAQQALEWLDRLRAMHDQRWRSRGIRSGFAHDETAKRFHDSLIRQAFPRGEIQMLRIRVGDADLGYLYNYVFRGVVSYYQSGLNFDLIEKHGRPGLVCHALVIEHNIRLGHDWYDLLAGDYRYKASLATNLVPMAHCVFNRNTPLVRLDDSVRRLVNARQQRKVSEPRSTAADETAEA